MTPYHHAVSSSKKWGGHPSEYMPIHEWFDITKACTGNFSHRALRHHAWGIQECVEKFGHALWLKSGKPVPTRLIAEQHVTEDCGFIPTVQDWLRPVVDHPAEWMLKVQTKSVVDLVIAE